MRSEQRCPSMVPDVLVLQVLSPPLHPGGNELAVASAIELPRVCDRSRVRVWALCLSISALLPLTFSKCRIFSSVTLVEAVKRLLRRERAASLSQQVG